MQCEDVLTTLKSAEHALRARSVAYAALPGSLARGEAGAENDIDILIDIDPEVVRIIYDYVGVKNYIVEMFGGPVDLVDRDGLKSHMRPSATADAIYAFSRRAFILEHHRLLPMCSNLKKLEHFPIIKIARRSQLS